MPGCRPVLQAMSKAVNGNPEAIRAWTEGGMLGWLTSDGPLPRQLPGPPWEELMRELKALPRAFLPILIDAGNLAVYSGKTVEFDAPEVEPKDVDEYKKMKKVRVELEYDSEGISVKLYHLGAPHQAGWYAGSGRQSPAFAPIF